MELSIEYLDSTQSKANKCEKCGGELGHINNGGVKKCRGCGSYTDRFGNSLSLRELGYCKQCGETFIKRHSRVASKDELYRCPECSTIHDNKGLKIDNAELVSCEHCNEYFRTYNYRAKLYNFPPIDSSCKCPACNHFLDKQGNVVDFGNMYKCNSCNISFSEQLADSQFGLTKCIECGEYIDHDGYYIDNRYIEYCEDCGIEFNSLEFDGVCPMCWKTPRAEV